MNPRVTNVGEQNVLGADGKVAKAIKITYYVGDHGPFTLLTNQQDLNSGAALQAMRNFANTLATLPTS